MKIGKRKLRPIPMHVIGLLLLGDAAIEWISQTRLYPMLAIDRPLWKDAILFLVMNLVLLVIRDRLPKVWEAMTKEKPD